jgi:hypothetical protein
MYEWNFSIHHWNVGKLLTSLSLEHIRLKVWKFSIIIRNDALILGGHCDMTTSSTSSDFGTNLKRWRCDGYSTKQLDLKSSQIFDKMPSRE